MKLLWRSHAHWLHISNLLATYYPHIGYMLATQSSRGRISSAQRSGRLGRPCWKHSASTSRSRGERPAGRAQLLAKRGHTGRVQNPAKVSENRPACGTAQHTLAVCFVFEKLEKSRKILVKIWRKFSKILAKFWQFLRKFRKNQQKFQQFLTKILRLKNGAKECIV